MQRVIAARVKAEGKERRRDHSRELHRQGVAARWVEPEEVADAALFLASPASASITGERLRVDAGRN
jgi:NAD(P)-dependent dehydrogenase (short-subunit alcohol dehydrogenase family)